MTPSAAVLILASAVTHAAWNLLSKREHPTAAFFLAANTVGFLCLTPALLIYGRGIGVFPPAVWMLLILTGVCQAIYFSGLAGAYKTGQLSVVYPLARSLPAIIVLAVTLILGRAHQVTGQCIVGAVLIVGGCLFLPMERFRDLRLENYVRLSGFLALVAALGTSGYSMIDDEALRRLREAPAMPLGPSQVTLLYAFFEGLCTSLWLSVGVLARAEGRAALREVWALHRSTAALAGVAMYLTYTLVLISMAYVTNVSYVVAFRQLSILFGAALGVIALSEPRHFPKFFGTALLFIGLVLVGTG